VFSPQVGRDLTKLYLNAAGNTLGGEGSEVGDSTSSFAYKKSILSGNNAMLEFETTVNGVLVNGVDIITCDEDAQITEFKVMIRPLKAINLVHKQMKAMLETMSQ
jgi:hypothetical protein